MKNREAQLLEKQDSGEKGIKKTGLSRFSFFYDFKL